MSTAATIFSGAEPSWASATRKANSRERKRLGWHSFEEELPPSLSRLWAWWHFHEDATPLRRDEAIILAARGAVTHWTPSIRTAAVPPGSPSPWGEP